MDDYMGNEVSVFIMDVSGSSKASNRQQISDYLTEIKNAINGWTEETIIAKTSHRAGDELVFIAEGFSSAYIISFYISRLWKFKDTPPYFGISLGWTKEDINQIDIDTWIHPLMKHARNANDYLKQKNNREQFHFELPDESTHQITPSSVKGIEQLINSNMILKQVLINDQTDIQSTVGALYLILLQQNKISRRLGRTTATISHHMKQGRIQLIFNTFSDVIHSLDVLSETQDNVYSKQLRDNIRQDVIHHLNHYFD